MPGTSEVTSDYSGSLTSTSSEDEEKEDSLAIKSENSALLWTSSGSKKSPLIMFRPESLITRDKKLKSIGEQYHLAYKMVKTESKLVRSVLAAYGFHEVHQNSAEFNLMWTGAHLKPFSLRSLQDFQKVNHFPRSYEITRKDRLYKNIERMAHIKGTKHFDFIPKSYLMPTEYQDFCAAHMKERGSWIVKPIASSRGRGIYLINNPNQVPLEDNIMVCKYINNPLLIDGFKFDVRVYVAITSYDPLLIYLFEEGLTRFATVKYEKAHKHLKNQMMHLTNYSINKKSHDYVRCEDPDVEDYGNKWSMSAMLRYLKQEGIDTSTLMSRIESVIIKSILAATLPIATACKMFVPHKENCIELYGFDILVDENLKPWILEGNLSPSLACDAPLDLKIKSSMIADFFSIAGFRCVDPMAKRPAKKPLYDLFQRPYSAQRSASFIGGSSNRGVKRPSSAGYKEILTGVSKLTLSTEESRAIAIAKEQYQRRGSFVRIFPTVETWELYGSFLEYKSNLNFLLAQKLFPDRAKPTHSSYPSSKSRSVNANQMLASRRQVISERFLQYERKLFSLEAHKKRRAISTQKKSKFRETPVGVDNTFRKKILRARHSSSDEESDDVEEEESETTCQSKRVKSAKAKPSLSSGDAAAPSKLTTHDSKISIEKISKSRVLSGNKGLKKALLSDALNEVPDKLVQTTVAECSNSSLTKSSPGSSLKSPVQRVYMYKSNSPVESETGSLEKQDILKPNIKPDAEISDTDQLSSSVTMIQKLTADSPAPSLSQEIARKLELINQNKVLGRTTRNQKIVNVLSVLRSGGNLGKLQARQAFSAYLSRVQHRLRIESESHGQDCVDDVYKQEEQMELVLKFLKRAAGNLCQSLSVVVPSRRLSIIDRKRILSKQLAEFVRIYNKESEALQRKRNLGLEKPIGLLEGDQRLGFSSQSISDNDFRAFIVNASESSLEEVLTAYTHKNKSASVFLGATKSKNSMPFEKDGGNVLPESSTTSMLGQQPVRGYSVPSTPTGGAPTHHLFNEELTDKAHHSGMTALPQATSLYSVKPSGMKQLTSTQRTSSSKPYMPSAGMFSASQSSVRQGSTSTRPVAGSIHYHTAANQEAISDALQKLAERHAARHYSAPIQLTALGNHLSNLNLSNASTGHLHKMGSSDLHHMNSPQRTSSLSDLASIDPSVQSMMDPGLQKLSHNASMDTTHEQKDLPLVSTLQDASHSRSTQMLSQQSNTLLQQSKAKHQAMLAQMLDVWRNKQQADLKSGKYMSKVIGSVPSSNTNEKLGRMYCCHPYSTSHSYNCPVNGARLSQAIDSVERDSGYNTKLKEMLLLERTEKLINCHTSERKACSGNNIFLKQVVSANRSGVPQSYNRSGVLPDKRNKLAQIKPLSQHLKKPTYNTSTFIKSRQQQTSDAAALSQSVAERCKKAETARNILYYENILQEINSLFEMGELPSKQWKDAYKRQRK